MLRNVTLTIDLHTVDAGVPARLLGAAPLVPGTTVTVPGGLLVFQAAALNSIPGEASVYRFTLQFGSEHAATQVGTWLYTHLRNEAVAVSIGGTLVPLTHRGLITALKRAA